MAISIEDFVDGKFKELESKGSMVLDSDTGKDVSIFLCNGSYCLLTISWRVIVENSQGKKYDFRKLGVQDTKNYLEDYFLAEYERICLDD